MKRYVLLVAGLLMVGQALAGFAGRRYYMDTENSNIKFDSALAACQSDTRLMIKRGAYLPGTTLIGVDFTGYFDSVFSAPMCKRRIANSDGSSEVASFSHITSNYECPPGATSNFGTPAATATCVCANAGEQERYGRCVPDAEADKAQADYKNSAGNSGVCGVGNPVNPATGAKFLRETDLAGVPGELPLGLVRHYISRPDATAASVGMGWGWRHSHHRQLVLDNATDPPTVRALRPDGAAIVFSRLASGGFTQDPDVNDRLEALTSNGVLTGYRFTEAQGDDGVGLVETYDAQGRIQTRSSLGGWRHTYTWSTDSTPPATAPGAGYLIAVTDSGGRQLRLAYDEGGYVTRVADPAGRIWTYAYDERDNLVSVTNPRNEQRQFHYNEPDHVQKADGSYHSTDPAAPEVPHLPNALTGITDQAGVRLAHYRYQFDGRAIETVHVLDALRHQFSYAADGSTQVTDPLGQVRNHRFAVTQGVVQPQDQDLPCSTGSPYKTVQSDANGNPLFRIDFNGNRTSYRYDTARNLELSRTEGLNVDGSVRPESRTITTQWHPSLTLPAKVAQPLKLSTYTYNPNGTLRSVTEQATTDATGSAGLAAALQAGVPARTWTYTYNARGQVLSIDGPRTDVADVTTFTYHEVADPLSPPKWSVGDLKQVSNALGHTTVFNEYDALGNPLMRTDPNGLVTLFSYDELGRLSSQTVGSLTTRYDYDSRGLLSTVTAPETTLSYGYDDAQRLTSVRDALGNHVDYVALDGFGNRLDERVVNASGALVRQQRRVYSPLNRLQQDVGGSSPATQITRYDYLLGGQLARVTDPLARVSEFAYDALNRLTRSTQPVPDPGVARPVTDYAYNGQDALTRVVDPRGLVTTYTVNGLGQRRAMTSPDTGPRQWTVDAAGNTLSDSSPQLRNFSYDALNRLTRVTRPDGRVQVFSYDQGPNALGRLSQVTEQNGTGSVVFSRLDIGYDALGRVNQYDRSVAGRVFSVQFSHDNAGRLAAITYPSGRRISHSFDGNGRVSAVATRAAGALTDTPVVSQVAYHAFGAVAQFTHGNGRVHTRPQDLDGRVRGYQLGAASMVLDLDDAGQVRSLRNPAQPAQANSYTWDGLGRLKAALLPATTYSYQYDALGNRTGTLLGGAAIAYTYPADKNWLSAVAAVPRVHDTSGQLQSIGAGSSFGHDAAGFLAQHSGPAGGTSYLVDPLGQRVRKTSPQTDVVYLYDPQGRLLAEHSPGGVVLKEYIWLGELPVAVVAP